MAVFRSRRPPVYLATTVGTLGLTFLVVIAGLASAAYYQQNPPWQHAFETTPVNTGTGTYTNTVSGGAPSPATGWWYPVVSSTTSNLATAHFTVQAAYYDDVPATQWGPFASPMGSSNANPGGIDLTLTCLGTGQPGHGVVFSWDNQSYNVWSSWLNAWTFTTPARISSSGIGIGGACPQTYIAPIQNNWGSISPLAGSCGPTFGNCTIVLYSAISFYLSTASDVVGFGCEWFAINAPHTCSLAGYHGNFQLQYVVT